MKNKETYFISDLHLGAANAPDSIESLLVFLNNLDHKKVKQLVILGDFLDRWALPISVNPKKYSELLDIDSECIKTKIALLECNKRGIKIFYMKGNHDFDISQNDLPDYINLVTPEQFNKDNLELYAEHGNEVDLFNAEGESDDGKIKFPLGYFKTRLNYSYKPYPMQKDLYITRAKEDIITDLETYRTENPNMQKKVFDALLDNFSARFLDALLKDVMIAFPKTDIESIEIVLPDGYVQKKINFVEDILPNYKEFVKHFYYNHLLKALFRDNNKTDIIQWEALINAIDPVRTGGLEWYAKSLKENNISMEKIESIVFGHTHMCQINEVPDINLIYANSGCWCSNILGPNTTSIQYNGMEIKEHNDDVCLEMQKRYIS